MTAEQTELLHVSILRVLDRNGSRFGLGPNALCVLLGEFGFSPNLTDMDRTLDYLADPAIEYVVPAEKGHFNPAARTWRITAKGTNYLRTHGY